jgi:hypothetical protein
MFKTPSPWYLDIAAPGNWYTKFILALGRIQFLAVGRLNTSVFSLAVNQGRFQLNKVAHIPCHVTPSFFKPEIAHGILSPFSNPRFERPGPSGDSFFLEVRCVI